MRILLVFSSSEQGGAERSLTRMALAAEAPVAYTLATLDGEGPWVDWCRGLGGTPQVLGERRVAAQHGRFGIGALGRLVTLVRRERFAVIYVIGLRASIALRLIKPLLGGARLVHGIRWNPDSGVRLDRVLRLAERIAGGLIDGYICNSQAAADTLVGRAGVPARKVRVIHNGLAALPGALPPLTGRPLQVVTVANLWPRKGHAEYLDVIAAVVARLPDARFVFVGRDETGGRLAGEIGRRGLGAVVRLAGFQPDTSHWLGESRLMVLPSLWGEGCPTSILEGFAHGLPVVAYAIDGVPELVDDQTDGFLVTPRDAEAMASAIVRLLTEPELAVRMGAAGRAKVEARFTVARCAERHTAVFQEFVGAEAPA